MTYYAIKLMSLVGLAHSVKMPNMVATAPTVARPNPKKADIAPEADEEPELVAASH